MHLCPACHTRLSDGRSHVRCRQCRALVRTAGAGADRVAAHDAAYFGEQAAYEMNSEALLARYLDFVVAHRQLAGARVLDVGCGDSPAAAVVARAGAAYTGLEPSDGPRDRLRARGVEVVAGLDEVDFRPDVVTLFEVLEHLPAPGDVLADLRRLLAPGGLLFVTTPNAGGLQARLRREHWEQARNDTHLCLYTRRALLLLLDECGYELVAWQRRIAFPGRGRGRALSDGVLQTFRLDGGLRALARPR